MKDKSPKKSGGFLHLGLGHRILGVIVCCLVGLFVIFAWNYRYEHSSSHNRTQMTRIRKTAVHSVPDYHPKKQTRGTHTAQSAESKMKAKVNQAK